MLNAGEIDTRRVTSFSLSARTASNMIHHLKPGNLVIAPGDRDDIVLATAMAALNGVPLAGLLLTSGIEPSRAVFDLCTKAVNTGLPVMLTQSDSYSTASLLDRRDDELPLDDTARAEMVMDSVAANLNTEYLKEHCSSLVERRLSPPAFRFQLYSVHKMRKNASYYLKVMSPYHKAAAISQERGIAQCILLGQRGVISK